MKVIKKLLILSGFLLLLIPAKTYANDAEEPAEQIYAVSESDDISIEQFVGVYDFAGNELGICMQFVREGTDYGYVICDNEKNVIEYSLGAGYPFIYDVILENVPEEYTVSETDCIFTEDGMLYYVAVSDGTENYLTSVYGDLISTDGICVASSNTVSGWNEVIIDAKEYTQNSNYTCVSSYYNYNSVIFSKDFIKNNCNRYACVVVAMLSICAQEGYFQLRTGNGAYDLTALRQAFNLLWSLSGTTVYKTEDSIQYGTTSDFQVARSIEDFCIYMTNTAIDVGYISNPSWTQIITHVGQGESAIYGTCIDIENDAGTVEESGHAVNVIGYATYRENTTGDTSNFLMVGDGWNDYPRYMKYNSSYFHSSYLAYVP